MSIQRRSGAIIAVVIAVVVLVSTAFAFYILRRPPTRDLSAVAVLPFVNRTGDPRNDALAARIGESLSADLADVPTLRVVYSGSSVLSSHSSKSRPRIAAELGVDGIIEGALLQAGARVRVEVTIIDGVHDAVLWSEQYDRSFSELDAVQRQIARAVGAHLRGALARDYVGSAPPGAPPTSSSTR